MVRQANFDRVAFVYDFLARGVFGSAIDRAQKCFLEVLPANSQVLILGGGTGQILTMLDRISKSFDVVYVEPSGAMLRKAEHRAPFQNIHVRYEKAIHTIVGEYQHTFDVIITNFFLDVFPEKELPSVMNVLRNKLAVEGMWLMADFVPTRKWWQRGLLKGMYWFFQMTTGMRSKSLPDFHPYFEKEEMRLQEQQHFYNGMVVSRVYFANKP